MLKGQKNDYPRAPSDAPADVVGDACRSCPAQFSLGAKPQQMLFIAVSANNFGKMRGFYMTVIGLKELPGSNPEGASTQSTSLSFTGAYDDSFLMLSHSNGTPPTEAGSLQRLVFKVIDAKAVVERARAAGSPILAEPGPAHGMPNIVAAAVRDPDGNTVELVQVKT